MRGGKGKGKEKEREREKRKVSGLCETFRVGWSRMVGLDFFFGKRKPRTEVELPVAFVFFSLYAE